MLGVLPELGEFALWMALPIAIWGSVLAFLGGRRGRGDLVLWVERSVHAVFILLAVASAGIVAAFLGDRFEYWQVAGHSSRNLGTHFKVAGLWAGSRGSLLLWTLNLGFFSSLAVWLNRRRHRELMPYVLGVLLVVLAFFIGIALFITPLFETLAFTPRDGRGMDPRLQNYWMTLHPPALHLGFGAFTISFAFAVAALLVGRLDARWLQVTRGWILTGWFFLTLAVVFGMRWAYEALGWGDYWLWDPVENASLLPWIVATGFLHSAMIQESRGMLKIWNVALVILTFILTLFATFLARSGLVESVHPPALSLDIAYALLGFMAATAIVCIVLILWRLPLLKSHGTFDSLLSRESAFLVASLVLLGIGCVVLWGTMFPVLSEGLTGTRVSVGPPFFNQVSIPGGLALLVLMGIGPVMAWRRADARGPRQDLLAPFAVGAGMGALLYLLGVRHTYALLTFALGTFALVVAVVGFWKETRVGTRIEGEEALTRFHRLVRRNRRRWGGHIVHVGVVVMFVGFAGAAYDTEVRETLDPGESVSIDSPFGHTYTLTYDGLSTARGPGVWRWIALMRVERNGALQGVLTTERRLYELPAQPATEVGIRSTFVEDLYVILTSLDEQVGLGTEPEHQRATFQVLVNPLVPWIWYGAFLMVVGALMARRHAPLGRDEPELRTAGPIRRSPDLPRKE